MTHFNISEIDVKRHIGITFSLNVESSYLNRGMILAIFNLSGKIPV